MTCLFLSTGRACPLPKTNETPLYPFGGVCLCPKQRRKCRDEPHSAKLKPPCQACVHKSEVKEANGRPRSPATEPPPLCHFHQAPKHLLWLLSLFGASARFWTLDPPGGIGLVALERCAGSTVGCGRMRRDGAECCTRFSPGPTINDKQGLFGHVQWAPLDRQVFRTSQEYFVWLALN